MDIVWTRHARERFFERSLRHGINCDEVEYNITKQKVKEKQKGKTIKTVFKIMEYYFTVIKEETKRCINVVSIWESNEKEVELWEKNQ